MKTVKQQVVTKEKEMNERRTTDRRISPCVGEFAIQQAPALYAEIDRLMAELRGSDKPMAWSQPSTSGNEMKLPSELIYPITQWTREQAAEAVVRDCVKVVNSVLLTLEPHKYPDFNDRHLIAVIDAGVRGAISEAILARYGLKEKS